MKKDTAYVKKHSAGMRILTVFIVLIVASLVCISPVCADDTAEIDDSIPPETPTSLPPPEEPTAPAPEEPTEPASTESPVPFIGALLGLVGATLVIGRK